MNSCGLLLILIREKSVPSPYYKSPIEFLTFRFGCREKKSTKQRCVCLQPRVHMSRHKCLKHVPQRVLRFHVCLIGETLFLLAVSLTICGREGRMRPIWTDRFSLLSMSPSYAAVIQPKPDLVTIWMSSQDRGVPCTIVNLIRDVFKRP